MIEFEGILYRSGSSHSFEAKACFGQDGSFSIEAEGEKKVYSPNEYEIEPKLGSSNRVIRFSDGVRMETPDHAAFSKIEETMQSGAFFRFVDWMETRWPIALGSIVGVIVFVILFLEYGMPVLAKYIAYEVPQSLRQSMSNSSLDAMDNYGLLEESYSMRIYQASTEAFDRALELTENNLNPEFKYELRIFKAPKIGPNAFALPSGTVVVTEEFVDLCETNEQMVAVFLHEIAHVELQHGLRSLIQDAGVFLIMSIALGDLSSLGGMAASLPTLAIESRYSQGFETEADLYAGRILEACGIGAEVMKDILILLHKDVPDIDFAQFLSSHPDLEERLDALDSLKSEN